MLLTVSPLEPSHEPALATMGNLGTLGDSVDATEN
jgi:hypothetical protein